MPSSFLSTYIFKHAWAPTVEGAFNKYPNEYQPNVLCLDILDRKLDENGILVTEKLMVSNFDQSETMKKAMRALGIPIQDRQITLEMSKLNLENKSYLMRSLNYTYFDVIKIHEQLNYSVAPDSQTLLTQSTLCDMDAKNYSIMLRWAVTLLEKLCLKVAANNMPKGRIAMNKIIPNLMQEFNEITHFTEIVEDLEALVKNKVEVAEKMMVEFGDVVLSEISKVQKGIANTLTVPEQEEDFSKEKEITLILDQKTIESKRDEIIANLSLLSSNLSQNSGQLERKIELIIQDAKAEIQKLVKILTELLAKFAENLKKYADYDCLAYNKEALNGMKKVNEVEGQINSVYNQAIRKIDVEVSKDALDFASQIAFFEEKFSRECRIGTGSERI